MLKIRKANGKQALDIVSIFLARSMNTFLISSGLFGTGWTGLFGPFCVIPSFAGTHGPTPYVVMLNWLSRVSSSCLKKEEKKEKEQEVGFFKYYCLQKSHLLLNTSCSITSVTSWIHTLSCWNFIPISLPKILLDCWQAQNFSVCLDSVIYLEKWESLVN